jgi:hypothetical protein
MIFKQLFRSKHQNSDPQVRLQAIEKLNKQVPEQKSILHELAFNDADIAVSLAALNKLDSFVLWYKMSEIAKNDRVQKKSQQYIENTLLNQQSEALNDVDKRKFMLEVRDPQLIEKLLEQSWIQQDVELSMALLHKLDKPQVQDKLLFESNNEQLKHSILSTLKDTTISRKLLSKIQKKSESSELKQTANKMLEVWLAAEKAPIELEQQVKMVLSRLLALKDQSDLLHIQQQQAVLLGQYSQLEQNFDCLTELKRTEIEQKQVDINQRVERTIAMLLPKWQAQQEVMVVTQNIANLVETSEQSLQQLSAQLATRISELAVNEIDTFADKITEHLDELQKLTGQVSRSEQTQHKQLEQLNNKLLSSLATLKSLPDFQQAIVLGQDILSKFADLDLPTDVSQIEAAEEYIREQKYQWRDALGQYQAQIPSQLSQQWNERLQAWQQSIKSLKNQINAEVSKCRNKLRAIESLVNQGKFKAAMGLYQKVQSWFKALPEQQQSQLERTFNGVKEQIENLRDWQDYISAPRKPALLSEIETLASNPLEVDAQGEAIKSLRYQWNSLGKSDTEADQALNDAFELAIEKAFAPCRAFYEKQQQEREQNRQNKQQLLKEIGVLGQQEIKTADLSKNLNNLQQKWRNIGEVDFKLRNDLYEKYQQLLAPLKERVSAYYQDNAEQKNKLVEKASKLVEMESVNEAIEQAKVLQAKWKTIEHAGKKAEKELWTQFRQANDSLFAKRAEESQLEKAQLKEQILQVNQQVSQLVSGLNDAIDKAAVQSALQEKQTVFDAIAELPAGERRALEQKVQSLLEQQKVKLSELNKDEKNQQYKNLFTALQTWQVVDELPEQVSSLSKAWQQCFDGHDVDISRHEVTIKMEIVAQVESPKKDAQMRQSIQMQLMAQKLQSGDSLNQNDLLKQWIKAGVLSKADMPLLKRIESLFLN